MAQTREIGFAIIAYLMPLVAVFIRGCCFYWLAKSFMKKKAAFCGGAAYFLIILLIYITEFSVDAYIIEGVGILSMFLMICWMDRRNYKQKLFLVITFFSFIWLASAMAEIIYDHLYYFTAGTDYMQNHPNMSLALFTAMCACYAAAESAFIAVEIWQILKVYVNKRAEMERKELVMLSLPSVMGVIGYETIRYYRVFYIAKIGKAKEDYDVLMFLYCAVAMITVIAVIVMYQNIKAKQEENLQAKLLAAQIDSIRKHVEQVESLYQNIHGIKHDMTNHILVLERLYAGDKAEEAKAYGEEMKAQLSKMDGGVKSGNPVADVILQEFKEEAIKRGISFRSEFHYPVDSDINVFDLSVILNNALQNAIENTGNEGERHISIHSYRRNNACMIEISNSFNGNIQWDAESGLPITSKKKPDSHGYGLSNIRRVARKYAGDIDIVLKEGEFCLCIMLMAE